MKFFQYFVFYSFLVLINAQQEIFDLLSSGIKNLTITNYNNSILVIGLTGTGKSTLVHYLASDSSEIEAVDDNDQYPKIIDHLDKSPVKITTTRSRTIIPEIIIDKNNYVWIDCPGFQDTRSTAMEIAGTYFIKSITDHIENIKIVFTTEQNSVSIGHDRSAFPNLIRFGAEFLTNIDKFEPILIVTKVPSIRLYRSNVIEMLNENVINQTVRFLNDYLDELKMNEPLNVTKHKLIEKFLHKSVDNEYDRIGVFYHPTDIGKFNEIPKMIKERETLLTIIQNQTNYTNINATDFGYPLSTDAKNLINEMSNQITNDITNFIRQIRDKIWKKLNIIGRKERVAIKRKIFFENYLNKYETLLENISTYNEIALAIEKLCFYTNITISNANLQNLLKQQNYIEIFKTIDSQTKILSPIEWINYFSQIQRKLLDKINWYTFINKFAFDLLSYDIQRNPIDFNLKSNNISNENFTITFQRLNELNYLRQQTSRSSLKFECKNNTILYQASIIFLSDIDYTKCPNVKNIHLIGYEKIFIDVSKNFRGLNGLALISEQIEIVNNVTIDLSGFNGDDAPPNKDGTMGKPEGIPGIDGSSGQDGGNFFLYANKIIDGKNLKVNVSGGNGGRGQNGSSGYSEAPELDRNKLDNFKNCNMKQYLKSLNYHYRRIDGEDLPDCSDSYYYFTRNPHRMNIGGVDLSQIKTYETYTVYARQCCKANGEPGKGGPGGIRGEELLFLNEKINGEPIIIKNSGSNGENGKNVETCLTWKQSFLFEVYCSSNRYAYFVGSDYNFHFNIKYYDREIDDSCSQKNPDTDLLEVFFIGLGQAAASGVSNALRSIISSAELISSSLINYKSALCNKILKTNEQNLFIHDYYKSYNDIENNEQIEGWFQFNPIAYIIEFNNLEQHFFDSNDYLEILPFYKSLFNRFNKTQYVESMPLLQTAILMKIHSIQSGQLTNMVIDVIGFLDLTLQHVDDLIDLNRTIAVYDRRTKYEADMNAMIKETNRYIENDIRPYIHEIIESLKTEFNNVIDEIAQLKHETSDNSQKKRDALKKLKQNIVARKLLGIFDVIGKALCFLGPEGAIIGSIVSIGANIGRSLIRDPVNVFNERISIPSAIEQNSRWTTINTIENIFQNLQNSIESDVDLEISNKIIDFKRRYSMAKTSGSIQNCRIIQNEFNIYVKNELKQIDNNEKRKKNLKNLNKAMKSMNVANAIVNVYNDIKDDEEKLNAAYEAIEQDEQTLDNLWNFEDKIYNEIFPSLINMENSLNESQKSFESQSKIGLSISNWKITDALQDAKIELTSMVKGFSNDDKIINLMDKLNGGMTIMINLYKQIQEYEEHIRLINYITDIQLISSGKDLELPEIYFNLEYNIKVNIIIGEYIRVMKAFKQLTFPFASSYLDMFHLPHLDIIDTPAKFKNHTDILATQLRQLKNQIILFNSTTINDHDHEILLDNFNNFTKPFYVWPNEFNRNEISQLISGADVTFLANIRNGSIHNAVKFKTIDINFVAKNGSNQSEIDIIMNSIEFNLTHSGISLYRCGKKFYRINTPPQIIIFGKIKENNVPTHRNLVYDKILNGGFMLSPYTYWHLKISGRNLSILNNYEFDIELNGAGQYVTENSHICEMDLEKYYEIDEYFDEN